MVTIKWTEFIRSVVKYKLNKILGEIKMTRRTRRTFSDEFKSQMVTLYKSGKPAKDIIREYDLTESTFHKWVAYHNNSQSFSEKDNRTPEQAELIRLKKENEQLKMENDILKQAALIMGRK